jgi:hypothetical protein
MLRPWKLQVTKLEVSPPGVEEAFEEGALHHLIWFELYQPANTNQPKLHPTIPACIRNSNVPAHLAYQPLPAHYIYYIIYYITENRKLAIGVVAGPI